MSSVYNAHYSNHNQTSTSNFLIPSNTFLPFTTVTASNAHAHHHQNQHFNRTTTSVDFPLPRVGAVFRPLKCFQCECTFSEMGMLTEHVKYEHWLRCIICNVKFESEPQLLMHYSTGCSFLALNCPHCKMDLMKEHIQVCQATRVNQQHRQPNIEVQTPIESPPKRPKGRKRKKPKDKENTRRKKQRKRGKKSLQCDEVTTSYVYTTQHADVSANDVIQPLSDLPVTSPVVDQSQNAKPIKLVITRTPRTSDRNHVPLEQPVVNYVQEDTSYTKKPIMMQSYSRKPSIVRKRQEITQQNTSSTQKQPTVIFKNVSSSPLTDIQPLCNIYSAFYDVFDQDNLNIHQTPPDPIRSESDQSPSSFYSPSSTDMYAKTSDKISDNSNVHVATHKSNQSSVSTEMCTKAFDKNSKICNNIHDTESKFTGNDKTSICNTISVKKERSFVPLRKKKMMGSFAQEKRKFTASVNKQHVSGENEATLSSSFNNHKESNISKSSHVCLPSGTSTFGVDSSRVETQREVPLLMSSSIPPYSTVTSTCGIESSRVENQREVPLLVSSLIPPSPTVTLTCAVGSSRVKHQREAPLLVSSLIQPSPTVTLTCAVGSSRVKHQREAPLLVSSLIPPSPTVTLTCAVGSSRVKHQREAPLLVSSLIPPSPTVTPTCGVDSSRVENHGEVPLLVSSSIPTSSIVSTSCGVNSSRVENHGEVPLLVSASIPPSSTVKPTCAVDSSRVEHQREASLLVSSSIPPSSIVSSTCVIDSSRVEHQREAPLLMSSSIPPSSTVTSTCGIESSRVENHSEVPLLVSSSIPPSSIISSSCGVDSNRVNFQEKALSLVSSNPFPTSIISTTCGVDSSQIKRLSLYESVRSMTKTVCRLRSISPPKVVALVHTNSFKSKQSKNFPGSRTDAQHPKVQFPTISGMINKEVMTSSKPPYGLNLFTDTCGSVLQTKLNFQPPVDSLGKADNSSGNIFGETEKLPVDFLGEAEKSLGNILGKAENSPENIRGETEKLPVDFHGEAEKSLGNIHGKTENSPENIRGETEKSLGNIHKKAENSPVNINWETEKLPVDLHLKVAKSPIGEKIAKPSDDIFEKIEEELNIDDLDISVGDDSNVMHLNSSFHTSWLPPQLVPYQYCQTDINDEKPSMLKSKSASRIYSSCNIISHEK